MGNGNVLHVTSHLVFHLYVFCTKPFVWNISASRSANDVTTTRYNSVVLLKAPRTPPPFPVTALWLTYNASLSARGNSETAIEMPTMST